MPSSNFDQSQIEILQDESKSIAIKPTKNAKANHCTPRQGQTGCLAPNKRVPTRYRRNCFLSQVVQDLSGIARGVAAQAQTHPLQMRLRPGV
eukprot:6140919-Karenia_brevis.AAC.1